MVPLLALAVGLTIGFASGGSLGGLLTTRWQWSGLTLSLFVAQAAARGRLPGMLGWTHLVQGVWVACSIALIVLLITEWQSPGMAVAACGVLLNVMVVVMNGRMPVGLPPTGQPFAFDSLVGAQRAFYQQAGSETLASALGDVVPIGVFGSWTMLSAGDIMLGVGVCVWITAAMTAVIGDSS